MSSLQEKVLEWRDKWYAHCERKIDKLPFKYSVDVLSGWMYYTPIYAMQELAMGNNMDSVVKTRIIGLGMHAIAMRPVGKMRDYVAQKYGVTKESPLIEQLKINAYGAAPIQAVAYAGIIGAGMAWSGSQDLEAAVNTWMLGVTTGIWHSLFYGHVQDGVRKAFRVTPAIKDVAPSNQLCQDF